MKLKKMYEEAEANGKTSNKAMWQSVEAMDGLLDIIKEEHPDEYWEFMREQHEILYGPHYNECYAKEDLDAIVYTGKDGSRHSGAHWTKDQVLEATRGLNFPANTTDCDKWVAFNSYYADMCLEHDEQTIIKDAHRFYFRDEDAPEGKIWLYMRAMIG